MVENEVSEFAYEGSPLEVNNDIEFNGTAKDEASADTADWLQAAFGSSSTQTQGCEAAHSRQKHRARVTQQTSPSAPKCTDSLKRVPELLPPFFVHVEDEPPDHSSDDATGKVSCPRPPMHC